MENLSLHTANAVSFHDTLLLIFHTQNIKKEKPHEINGNLCGLWYANWLIKCP